MVNMTNKQFKFIIESIMKIIENAPTKAEALREIRALIDIL